MFFHIHHFLIFIFCGSIDALQPFDKQLAKYPTCGTADFQDVSMQKILRPISSTCTRGSRAKPGF